MLGVHAHAPHDTSRTSAQLEAHAVVIGALLSALARLMPGDAVRCDWRLALLASAVCLLARTPSRILQQSSYKGTCSGAHTCARLPMSTCATSHTHTAPLSHALGLTHLSAHAHKHMHTARQTASQTRTGYHMKDTHRHTHMIIHSCLHTHIHTRTHTARRAEA